MSDINKSLLKKLSNEELLDQIQARLSQVDERSFELLQRMKAAEISPHASAAWTRHVDTPLGGMLAFINKMRNRVNQLRETATLLAAQELDRTVK